MPEKEIHQSYYAIIPANVRYDKELKDKAKLLYGEITALCNSKGYCWATNNYFAELYGVSKETISRLISNLADKGYVTVEIIYDNKQIIERRIHIVQAELVQQKAKINTPIDEIINTPIDEKINTPIDEIVKDNIKDINNTLFNNQSINQACTKTDKKEDDTIDKIDEIEYEYIKKRIAKNIGYPLLTKQYGDIYEEMYNLLVDTATTSKKYITISKEKIPATIVRGRLLSLNQFHVEYVIGCLKENKTKVKNIKAYNLTCLYNAKTSMGSFITNEINQIK